MRASHPECHLTVRLLRLMSPARPIFFVRLQSVGNLSSKHPTGLCCVGTFGSSPAGLIRCQRKHGRLANRPFRAGVVKACLRVPVNPSSSRALLEKLELKIKRSNLCGFGHRCHNSAISQKHKRGAKSPAIQGARPKPHRAGIQEDQTVVTPAHKLMFVMRVETVNLR